MNKSPIKKKRKAVTQLPKSESNVHKIVNWVVSIILIAFAFWSIKLNAESKALFNQTSAITRETDNKIVTITQSMQSVLEVCQKSVTGIPSVTTGTN